MGSLDYDTVSNVPLGFSESSTVGEIQCLNISILEDSLEEITEDFTVRIAVQYNTMSEAVQESFISIIDNDGEEIVCMLIAFVYCIIST